MSDERCAPAIVPRPGRRPNRPGRDHLDLRVGTHGVFKAQLLRALGDHAALDGLTGRDDDEPAIALLDAWAAALDVLAFYSERLADEGYLRTATERRSLLELARAVGYELRPGVAATTYLAFAVTATPDGPQTFPIPVGTRVQSVPAAGELPQVFETVQELTARPGWNAMPLVCVGDHDPSVGDDCVALAGATTGLQQGDRLLVLGGGRPPSWAALRRVSRVEPVDPVSVAPLDPDPLVPTHTVVHLDRSLAADHAVSTAVESTDQPGVVVLRQRAALFGWNAPPWNALPVSLRIGELDPTPTSVVTKATRRAIASAEDEHALISRDALVPPTAAASAQLLAGAYAGRQETWAGATFAAGTGTVFLDQAYPQVLAGSWVVLTRMQNGQEVVAVRRVDEVTEQPVTDFALSGRCTRLVLSGGDVSGFSPRNATVLCQGEPLPGAAHRLLPTLPPTTALDIDRGGSDIAAGRVVVVDGLDATTGARTAETVKVQAATDLGDGAVRLSLQQGTTVAYDRASVRVLANVAKATHGESNSEVLGSGDQRVPFAAFRLRKAPLTYVPGATTSGARTTLAVWVNGVRWREVPSLHGQAPDAPVYTVRRADDGEITVRFGDGRTGARLPTGRDNVVATYRVGVGRAAELPARRLTLLVTRPLGVQDVTNPVAADGSDDPEPRDQARRNAPLSVQTLGRIVSRADYENFARAFAGVAKARADIVESGRRQVVVTVAGPDGDAVAGETVDNLRDAIEVARESTVPVALEPYAEIPFTIVASLAVARDRRFADVEAAVRAALVTRFAFDRIDFAQPVTRGDILATAQGVPGVEGVVLAAPATNVVPRPGRADEAAAGGIAAAELARLGTVSLSEVTP